MSNSVVIDTNAYSAFKRGREAAVGIIKAAETIIFSPTVLGELLAGFDLGNRAEQNRQELETFLKEPNVLFLTINAQTAEQHATIYRQLRQQGTPIPTAAMALQLEMGVFTYDAHFSKIEGLTIVQREEDLG